MDWGSIAVAALGITFGMTAFTVLSVRSETDKPMMIGMFLWTMPLVTLIFALAGLPPDLGWTVGLSGLAIGILCVLVIFVARHVERKYET